jgi:hypothetical protein
MTKLFDAACVTTTRRPLEKTGDVSGRTLASPEPIPKLVVNLTLTTQRRRRSGKNAPTAWTLQSLSCKTNRGMRVGESGTDLSRRAGCEGKAD